MEKEYKFTPGPWEIVDLSSKEYVKIMQYDDGYNNHIADVIDRNNESENARLIVEAPEMYYLLQQYALLGAGKCEISEKQATLTRDIVARIDGRK